MITITPQYLAEQGLSPTIIERFWREVVVIPYDRGCWLWCGHTVKGYGEISKGSVQSGSEYAHRMSWILHWGPIPVGSLVCHHCDTPRCVRPDHLFLGDQTANMRDCANKGRTAEKDHRGELNPKHKLTWPEVETIRKLNAQGLSNDKLAEMFHVTNGTIWFIVKGLTWRK